VTARPYEAHDIRQNLSLQITSSVQWLDSIRFLIETGISHNSEMEFEEIGHGNVLKGMLRKIRNELKEDFEEFREKTEEHKQSAEAEAMRKDEKSEPASEWDYKVSATADIAQLVKLWNTSYPVGTRVNAKISGTDDTLETRTEAMLLFGHRAVIYLKEHEGYFDLKEISPV